MWYPAPPCNEGHIRMEGMSHRHVLKLEAKVIFYFILPYVVLVVYSLIDLLTIRIMRLIPGIHFNK